MIEWYDIKTKIKSLIRRIGYSRIGRWLMCTIIVLYMKLVYYTSKKVLVNANFLVDKVSANAPVLAAVWHNRVMMIAFLYKNVKKINPNYKFAALSSKHGDGRFVGEVMARFKVINVYGSSKHKRKASRGIDAGNFKQLFAVLKANNGVVITPDGPRGPARKIHGKLLEIAQISGAYILPVSYSSSNYFKLATWDKFVIPLPFSRICYYFGEPIKVEKNLGEEQLNQMRLKVEQEMNLAELKSEEGF